MGFIFPLLIIVVVSSLILRYICLNTAVGQFIEVIRANRSYDDDRSRKACIAVFKLLGEEHEVTRKHRRDFSSALY